MNVFEKLRAQTPVDVFSEEDAALVLPDLSEAARYNKLSREVKKGTLLRLKRGVYAYAASHQRKGLHPFVVAHKLYFPSYVSFESALSHYQVIPEGISITTCATTKASVRISTPIGAYQYRWLPQHIYSVAIEREEDNGHVFLIAHPLKALLDIVYTRKKNYGHLGDIEADLRLDLGELARLLRKDKNKDIDGLKQVYKREQVTKTIDMILWELL